MKKFTCAALAALMLSGTNGCTVEVKDNGEIPDAKIRIEVDKDEMKEFGKKISENLEDAVAEGIVDIKNRSDIQKTAQDEATNSASVSPNVGIKSCQSVIIAAGERSAKVNGSNVEGDLLSDAVSCSDIDDTYDAIYDLRDNYQLDTVVRFTPVDSNLIESSGQAFSLVCSDGFFGFESVGCTYTEISNSNTRAYNVQPGFFEIILSPSAGDKVAEYGFTEFIFNGFLKEKADMSVDILSDRIVITSSNAVFDGSISVKNEDTVLVEQSLDDSVQTIYDLNDKQASVQ